MLRELQANANRGHGALAVLAKIEIGAINATNVTASKIQQFIRHIPAGPEFSFIKSHPVYYITSHATLAPGGPPARGASRLDRLRALIDEFQRYADAKPEADAGDRRGPSDAAVIAALRVAADELRIAADEIAGEEDDGDGGGGGPADGRWGRGRQQRTPPPPSLSGKKKKQQQPVGPAGGGGAGDSAARVALSVTARLESVRLATRPLINCRAVAELVDELYHAAFARVAGAVRYEYVETAADGPLDRLLKLSFFADAGKAHDAGLSDRFAEEMGRHKEEIVRSAMITDLEGAQQVGSEYVLDASYRVFTGNVYSRRAAELLFPVISTDVTVLGSMDARNLFFHPGLVCRLLNMSVDARDEAQAAPLRRVADFCSATAEELFLSFPTTKESPASVELLAERLVRLTSLGLDARTAKTYVRMSLTRSVSPPPPPASLSAAERKALAAALSELVHHLLLIVYNAHLFLLCLERYSPTFLCHNGKKLLLEQQRSTLIGPHDDLQFIWDNVVLNVNHFFHTWFTEDDFSLQTAGATDAERRYLYRDLTNKWGEILFTHRTREDTQRTTAAAAPSIETADVVRACLSAAGRGEDGDDEDDGDGGGGGAADPASRYRTLLPMTAHPSFCEKFTALVVVPEYLRIMEMDYETFRERGGERLVNLIYMCQLLLPEQINLYNNLSSLYTLTHFVPSVDVGTFKSIYGATQEIIAALERLGKEKVRIGTDLLAELIVHSLLADVRADVEASVATLLANNRDGLARYAQHVRKCRAILATRAVVAFNPHVVTLYHGERRIHAAPAEAFFAACERIAGEGRLLAERLQTLQRAFAHLAQRFKHITDNAVALKDYVGDNAPMKEFISFRIGALRFFSIHNKKLQQRLEGCEAVRRRAAGSLAWIAGVAGVLSAKNIRERGLADCVTEAAGLARQRVAPAPPARDLDAPQVARIIKDAFPAPAGEPAGFLHMSSATDAPAAEVRYTDLFDRRYEHLADFDRLRGWYVEPVEAAQRDLTSPFASAERGETAAGGTEETETEGTETGTETEEIETDAETEVEVDAEGADELEY